MENEGGSLSSFLGATLNAKVTSDNDSLSIDSETTSAEELNKQVTKFIYRRHLNHKYWVAIERDGVRIHVFEVKKGQKKKRRGTPPSTIKHGW
jgi:prolyl oligopeptidase PreP (S9A serine peptidase family)